MARQSLFIQKGRFMKVRLLIILGSFLMLSFSSYQNDRKYRGIASDLKQNKEIYSENHVESYFNGKLNSKTTYYIASESKDTIARRTMNFKNNMYRPDFRLEDFRSGYIEGAEIISNSKVKVFTRESYNEELESKIIDIPGDFVVDGGLTNFFRTNWGKLLNGEIIEFYFITPAKLDYFKFRVYSMGKINHNGVDGLKIRLEINNWFLRQLVDPVDIIYSLDNKEILSYRGISNINDNNGKSYKVLIDYSENFRNR